MLETKLVYDRAGRSEGVAYVTYENVQEARTAIREFDGANAKGQPIRLTLQPLPPKPTRRDNPFDRVENPRSLFDRIEAPGGRGRRRSQSPRSDVEGDKRGGSRRGGRRGYGAERTDRPDRRSDVTRPAPENIDRYVPGQSQRSSSRREGRRPGERRERAPRGRENDGRSMVNGRPRKTQEELDAEMEDYWATNNANGQSENGGAAQVPAAPAAQVPAAAVADDDIDMIE